MKRRQAVTPPAIALDRSGRRKPRAEVERPAASIESAPLLVQVLLVERERAFVSGVHTVELSGGGRWPSPFPGGRAPVGDDWDAPSSAFRKLEEALAWMERPFRAGERCIDLGASPGGWSHVALMAGARVIAVDRADLDPRIARHPRLEHVRCDGFLYVPQDPPLDWVLSDIIAKPERSLELLERWARNGWAQRLVFHLKFQGVDQYGLVEEARLTLRSAGCQRVRAKHLFYDKNEVTVWAER